MTDFDVIGDEITSTHPITALCIVADKNKAPKGFVPVIKCVDDQSDADLWRDGFFTINRQVRYICVTKDIPESNIKTPLQVVTNMIIVRESDPIPHGYVAIDYTADSRERALRKKYICIRTEPLDRVVDAIGMIIILGKTKKVPREYTSAGEVDSLVICYKVVSIPDSYKIQTTNSTSNLETKQQQPSGGLYPGLPTNPSSAPADLDQSNNFGNFTVRNVVLPRVKAIDGIDFKVNPCFVETSELSSILPDLSNFDDIEKLHSDDKFYYSFATEQSVLS